MLREPIDIPKSQAEPGIVRLVAGERAGECLILRGMGRFDFATYMYLVDKVVELAAKHKCNRLLVDTRSLDGAIPVPDRFYIAERLANSILTMCPGLRVIVLVAQSNASTAEFAMTVAKNRGIEYHITADVMEAIRLADLDCSPQEITLEPRELGSGAKSFPAASLD